MTLSGGTGSWVSTGAIRLGATNDRSLRLLMNARDTNIVIDARKGVILVGELGPGDDNSHNEGDEKNPQRNGGHQPNIDNTAITTKTKLC